MTERIGLKGLIHIEEANDLLKRIGFPQRPNFIMGGSGGGIA